MMHAPTEAGRDAGAPEQRDRVIPLRKSDIIDALVAEGRLDEADEARFRQLIEVMGEGLWVLDGQA